MQPHTSRDGSRCSRTIRRKFTGRRPEAGRISDYVCEAPERQRDNEIKKAKDTLPEAGVPERGRAIPAPATAREPRPGTPVPAKAPEIELSR